jgi:hypothetical protein
MVLREVWQGHVADTEQIGQPERWFPLRNRVQEFIDKRFYRKKYDAQKVLDEFAITCRNETDINRLVTRLAEGIDETLQPEKVSVWIKDTKAQRREDAKS